MAKKGINKVIIVGNLGADPELRYLPNGNPVANLTVATSESWTDKLTGKPQERTEWHRVMIFGKLAEIASEYAKKGSQVYLEGRNQTREWEKDGIKRYITEIIVDNNGTFQMLGRAPGPAAQGSGEIQNAGSQQQRQQQRPQQQSSPKQQSRPQQAPGLHETQRPQPLPSGATQPDYPDLDSFSSLDEWPI